MSNLREGIQAKMNHLTDCIHRKDFHGISERFFQNAKFMPSHEHDVVGVHRIEQWYRHRLANEEREHSVVFEVKDVDDFDQIVAVAGAYTDLHDNVETGHGKFLMVLEKHAEDEHHKYKIHYLMYNSDQAPHQHSHHEEHHKGHHTEVDEHETHSH